MKLLILSVLTVTTVNAKDRNWEPGKVIDQEVTTRHALHDGQGHPINIVTQTVIIAGDDYSAPLGRFYQEYTAQRILQRRWTKTAVLIVNTPVKFAVEKRKLFLVDDDGK